VQRVAALLRWEAQLTGGDLGVPMVKRGWIGVRARVAWEGLESLRPGIEEHLQLQRHSCVARLLPVASVTLVSVDRLKQGRIYRTCGDEGVFEAVLPALPCRLWPWLDAGRPALDIGRPLFRIAACDAVEATCSVAIFVVMLPLSTPAMLRRLYLFAGSTPPDPGTWDSSALLARWCRSAVDGPLSAKAVIAFCAGWAVEKLTDEERCVGVVAPFGVLAVESILPGLRL